MTPVRGSQPALTPTGDVSGIVDLGVRLQSEASAHNIHNVFDDGGYKELLLLRLFNLRKLQREGDDAVDEHGRRYEIKTVARVSSRGIRKHSLSVTTEHTLTLTNIERYRRTFLWIVAVFDQAHPESIHEITPQSLEPYFSAWEARLLAQAGVRTSGSAPDHLNNPKVPLDFIKQHGLQVYPPSDVSLPAKVREGLEATSELAIER